MASVTTEVPMVWLRMICIMYVLVYKIIQQNLSLVELVKVRQSHQGLSSELVMGLVVLSMLLR